MSLSLATNPINTSDIWLLSGSPSDSYNSLFSGSAYPLLRDNSSYTKFDFYSKEPRVFAANESRANYGWSVFNQGWATIVGAPGYKQSKGLAVQR